MWKLEDLYLEGQAQGSVQKLTFIQEDVHGHGMLDGHEYAIGLRRGTLSKPNDCYNIQAPVHESMHRDFAFGRWSLLPDLPMGVEELVKELIVNIWRPYHQLEELSDVVSPRPEDGMFVYRLLFIPRSEDLIDLHFHGRMSSDILAPNGKPVASGTQVLSPVHPFLVLPALIYHTSRPFAEDPPDQRCDLSHYKKWVEDGWPEAVAGRKPIPEEDIVDFGPEVEREDGERRGSFTRCLSQDLLVAKKAKRPRRGSKVKQD
ncbi:hypothetical protein BKA70DRAFT_1312243 [Coprinopsis sp. MPI-PUGE-AT-0042]|nr:hypothetical protein BKA70DRAFT_1312243 [Coprinopsis sp. MPI-PUGE-AT-0042]